MTEHVQAPREAGWQAEHAKRYIETGGKDGHIWNGVPTLLLTTKGARTGKPYTTPLIYGLDGEHYLIVASIGGAPKNPQWYRNLVANPEVGVQVEAEKFNARARPATPEEKPALWRMMASIYPAYDEMQKRTTRDIPVVIIERA